MIFKILCLVNIFLCYSLAQYPGTRCTVSSTRNSGVCQYVQNCPSVIQDIRNRRSYTRCGFEGFTEIVCCPSVSVATTTTTRAPNLQNLRISERKCIEYSEAVYEYTAALTLDVDPDRKRVRIDKCGHKVTPLIVGGEIAKPREFPHMALVGYDNGLGQPTWQCGGALVSEQFVLTAGHCLNTRNYGDPKFIRVGDLDILSENDDARPKEFRISEIHGHPNYRGNSKYNDIALLKLDSVLKIDPYKRPACLPNSRFISEENAIATGWGQTQWSGESSSKLQKVTLQKFSQRECNASYEYEFDRRLNLGIVDNTQLCYGSRNDSRDTCQGDSGGPLQVYHSLYCMYKLIGVTSFGIACGNPGTPGVYTRIYPYLDWIERVIWGA